MQSYQFWQNFGGKINSDFLSAPVSAVDSGTKTMQSWNLILYRFSHILPPHVKKFEWSKKELYPMTPLVISAFWGMRFEMFFSQCCENTKPSLCCYCIKFLSVAGQGWLPHTPVCSEQGKGWKENSENGQCSDLQILGEKLCQISQPWVTDWGTT